MHGKQIASIQTSLPNTGIAQNYQPIFEKIIRLLKENNLAIASQHADDLIAEWQLENDWLLTMECERYSSNAITLSVMNPKIGPPSRVCTMDSNEGRIQFN